MAQTAAALLALLFSFFVLALGAPTPNFNVLRVHHSARADAPSGYKATAAVDPDTLVSLRIALKTDMTALVDALYQVSTPGSANYRQYLSKNQVAKLTAPSDETLSTVEAWLRKSGVEATPGATNQWLNIELPVSAANALLDADFALYTNPDTGASAVRTLTYALPETVYSHIDYILGANNFPVRANKGVASVQYARNSTLSTRAADASCADAITPKCLQDLYNIPTEPATQPGNSMVVSSFVDSFASSADLQEFFSEFRPDIASPTGFNVVSLGGGQNDESQPSVEGSLDIQYSMGIATNVPTSFFTVRNEQSGDVQGFLDLVNVLIAQDEPPTVLTTSFGFPEELISQDIAVSTCNAYAQLGARGVSILFSSGDSGVDDGQATECTTFRPTFPSGCPFVTVVGATQGVNPETAAPFSSGGFSNIFAQPDYQKDAVEGYLAQLGDTNAGLFQVAGRGYPDVSAAGVAYQVNIGGVVDPVSGTSASTPLFASMVALLNDRLIAQGQPTMGFLNPFLYSNGLQALTDITSGNNPGCGTDGFPADEGWDPVTGLGTPDFNKFAALLGV